MNQELTRLNQNQLGPPAPDRVTGDLRRSLICFKPSQNGQPMALARALTTDERQAIVARLDHVEGALVLRDRTRTERAITALLISFPSGRAAGDEAKVIVGAYVLALNDLPPWAVEQTAREWMRGEGSASNLAFQPSAAELHRAAVEKVVFHQRAAAELHGLLEGKPRDEHPAYRSRERTNPQDLQRQLANHQLASRAEKLGLSPDVLDSIPDAPTSDRWTKPTMPKGLA